MSLRKLCTRALSCRNPAKCNNISNRYLSTPAENTAQEAIPTSYFNITPATKTEVTAHDIKAATLTKALYIDSFPPSVAEALSKSTTEFHTTFKRKIFETFFFEPTERQPTTLAKERKAHDVIVKGLYAELMKLVYAKVNHDKVNIQFDTSPYFEHSFYRKLPDNEDPVPFLINGNLSHSLLCNQPAYPMFTVEQCLQTADHAVEWDDILKPTLDIAQEHIVDIVVNGKAASHSPRYPYTRVIFDTASAVEWSDTSRARGVYFLFARLASEAIRDGYSPGDMLDVPKLGVYISSSAYSYHFVFYQLNTLDMTSDSGVKNLVWGQSIDQITSPLVKYAMVEPQNLLGPHVLHDVCDRLKVSLFYDLPLRNDVVFD